MSFDAALGPTSTVLRPHGARTRMGRPSPSHLRERERFASVNEDSCERMHSRWAVPSAPFAEAMIGAVVASDVVRCMQMQMHVCDLVTRDITVTLDTEILICPSICRSLVANQLPDRSDSHSLNLKVNFSHWPMSCIKSRALAGPKAGPALACERSCCEKR